MFLWVTLCVRGMLGKRRCKRFREVAQPKYRRPRALVLQVVSRKARTPQTPDPYGFCVFVLRFNVLRLVVFLPRFSASRIRMG